MSKNRIIELLEDKIAVLEDQNERHLSLIDKLNKQLEVLTAQLSAQTETLKSLEKSFLEKNAALDKKKNQLKGLSKLISNESEQQKSDKEKPVGPSPKERKNNGAKRKKYFDLQEKVTDCYPDIPDFDLSKARKIWTQDVIRYEFVPPQFIKHIYREHRYSYNDAIVSGHAPKAPLQNSLYDGSFIAGIAQLRYIYSMSVERIVKYFAENGFDLHKATAHGLLKKTADLFENLHKALREAILEDTYLCCDETFHNVLVKELNNSGKGVKKGYFWGALAVNIKLAYYFYENGSRGKDVILDLLKNYKHTIQTDAFAPYRILESDQYPDIKRLGCFQHVKRKFIDAGNDPDAKQVVDLINRLYQIEHKHKIGKDDWTKADHYAYRQRESLPVMAQINETLQTLKNKPEVLPQSDLRKAVEYMLTEWNALLNIFSDGSYTLDNNLAERYNRYISMSRRNSLFFGSHEGAKRGALFYSLACSCRMHNINFFEYLSDVINKAATLPPTTSTSVYRALLPDKWKKENAIES